MYKYVSLVLNKDMAAADKPEVNVNCLLVYCWVIHLI